MPRNDDGEFELILGNKQLLSVFFLVVILLGVFFTLGYVVGRSSGPVGVVETTSTKQGGSAAPPPVVESDGAKTAAETTDKPSPTAVSSAPKPVEPVKTAQTAPPPAPVPAKTEDKPKSTQPDKTVAQPTAPVAVSMDEPQPGQRFVQPVATDRAGAQLLAEVLAKRGFHCVVAPAPNGKLYRVLVGPLKDTEAISRAKADLEAAGFKNSIVQKY